MTVTTCYDSVSLVKAAPQIVIRVSLSTYRYVASYHFALTDVVFVYHVISHCRLPEPLSPGPPI